MSVKEKIEWCIDQHRNTNHFYDKYIPYEFHLRMVAQAAEDFKHLTPKIVGIDFDSFKLSCYAHDLIEDTRTSYNDVVINLGWFVANVTFAVTNEKGKSRKDRANDKYYEGIRNTEGAIFVKLCDRIANVQYSKMTKSGMFEKYKKENTHFMEMLNWNGSPTNPYFEMFHYLIKLFDE